EDVDAKARDPGNRDREVALHLLGELGALRLVHQRVGEDARHFGVELLLRQRLHRALRLHARRKLGGDEEVGSAGLAHRRQQLVHVGAGLIFGERSCRHGAQDTKRRRRSGLRTRRQWNASAELGRTIRGVPCRGWQKTTTAAFSRWTVARAPRARPERYPRCSAPDPAWWGFPASARSMRRS